MQVVPLTDVPQHTDTAARWIWDEWHVQSGLSLEVTRSRLLEPVDCPPARLALFDGKPAGVLSFRRFRRGTEHPPSLFIDALYVIESLRGRGIGSALLADSIGRAHAFSSDLFVYTDKRDWYEKRGWTVTESRPGAASVVLVLSATPGSPGEGR